MRSWARLLLVAAAVVVVVAAVVAWRGRDGGGGHEVTHAELVARANAICAALARKNGSLEAAPRPYDEQAVDFFTRIGDNVAAAQKELAALSPPSDDAGALDRIVGLYDDIGAALERAQAAASVEQDGEAAAVVAEISRRAAEAVPSERELGICPGKTSAAVSIGANVRRTRPNPLTETGTLG